MLNYDNNFSLLLLFIGVYKRSDFQWLGRIFRWLANDWNSKRKGVGSWGACTTESLREKGWLMKNDPHICSSMFAFKIQGFCGFVCVLLKSSSFDAFITIAYWCRTELACVRFAYQKKILLWTFIPSQSLRKKALQLWWLVFHIHNCSSQQLFRLCTSIKHKLKLVIVRSKASKLFSSCAVVSLLENLILR